MKKVLLLLFFSVFGFISFAQDAKEIIKKADELMQGETNYSEMTMQIVRPKWTRSISFKSCSKGSDYALTLITAPAKEQGQSFLKVENEMWNWNPSISKVIKLGPSMLSQGWMGSDFSNDELLNESSIVSDYTHSILATETVSSKPCYKIECKPTTDAEVVWGKQIRWISKDGYMLLKTEYYDEDEYLVKTETASDIKTMDGKEMPTKFEIIPADEPDNKTIVTMDKIIFDISVDESFFSQQTLKKGLTIEFPNN
jgi:outer membrane lipoprotein-sorting protein